MDKIKHLFRNINILNVLLFVTALLLMDYVVLPLFQSGFSYTLPAVRKDVTIREENPGQKKFALSHSPADYVNFAENNLFHPDRKIPAEKKESPDAAPLPKPEFVLYGTLITDEIRLAYLEDLKAPRSTPGHGKRQTALKLGESISGFTLKKIDPDEIILQRGGEKMVVKVHATVRQTVEPPAGAVSKTAPGQRPSRPAQPSLSPARRTQAAVQPPKTPQETARTRRGIVQPPSSPEEQSIFNLFDKNRKK